MAPIPAGRRGALDPGGLIGRGRDFIRRQHFVILMWGLLNVVLLVAGGYAGYRMVLLLIEYSRAAKEADSGAVVTSNDLFNAAMDDEPEDTEAREKARVPSGAEILRRVRTYEVDGGGRRDLLGSLDPAADKYPAAAKPEDDE